MPVQFETIQPLNAAAAKRTIADWRARFCCNPSQLIIDELLSPTRQRHRLCVKLGLKPDFVWFSPSWFAVGSIVVVLLRIGDNLSAAFYDQSAGAFLQAIAHLSVQERINLGSPKRARREQALATLINDAQQCQQPTPLAGRRPVYT